MNALTEQVPFVVLKFGGTSVSTPQRLKTIGEVMRQKRSDGVRVVTVVSALSQVTDTLKKITECSPEQSFALVDALETRHFSFAQTLGLGQPRELETLFRELRTLLETARPGPTDFLRQAAILAFGELLSSRLAVAFLRQQGLDVQWIDARTVLHATYGPFDSAWSKALSVNCRCAPDEVLQRRLAQQGELFLTQGFIAQDENGETVILGRGGSDTSAAYFGVLLNAQRVEIWTDVPGMFSANPRLVPDARLLKALDYDEAQEIASTGAKVLHPRCLPPCREARVPMVIKDTEHPHLDGTAIGVKSKTDVKSVKALSVRKGLVLVSMETVGMWQQVGFLSDVFAVYKKQGLSVGLIATSETNVTVSLDPSENLLNTAVLAELQRELAVICRVKMHQPCAAVTVVGRGMRSLLHRLTPWLNALEAQHIYLVTQSSNDLNFTVVVDEAAADQFLPSLHSELMRSGAMNVNDDNIFGPTLASLR
jgi:bifunctional diaminopimelate decarboxylase / aspartate kinase